MFIIGKNGLQKSKTLQLWENNLYYIGASNSPDLVILIKIEDKLQRVIYRNYPFSKDLVMEKWIFMDLAKNGCKTQLDKTYFQLNEYYPYILASYCGEQKAIDPRDLEYITLEFIPKDGINLEKYYGQIKDWGIISNNEKYWTVKTMRKNLPLIKEEFIELAKVQEVKLIKIIQIPLENRACVGTRLCMSNELCDQYGFTIEVSYHVGRLSYMGTIYYYNTNHPSYPYANALINHENVFHKDLIGCLEDCETFINAFYGGKYCFQFEKNPSILVKA